jgi:hypothetical protein
MGLEPGTTKADLRRCLENWNKGDNGIVDLSRAYRLKPGSGWLIPPCVLHAPGSLCTYEPQWGSDVFGMYQSLVEGREVPWSLLVKDMPKEKHQDLDFIVEQLDWDENLDPNFKENHYLEPVPVADTRAEGYVDRWIVYGKIKGEQLFTAKELTVEPGAKCKIKDTGAYGLITVQGKGRMNKLALDPLSPAHRGRSFLHRGRGQSGRDFRKHQRRRAPRRPTVFRTRSESERPQDGCLSEEQVLN